MYNPMMKLKMLPQLAANRLMLLVKGVQACVVFVFDLIWKSTLGGIQTLLFLNVAVSDRLIIEKEEKHFCIDQDDDLFSQLS